MIFAIDLSEKVALTRKEHVTELFAQLADIQQEYPREVVIDLLLEIILYKLNSVSQTPRIDAISAATKLTKLQVVDHIISINSATGQSASAAITEYIQNIKKLER